MNVCAVCDEPRRDKALARLVGATDAAHCEACKRITSSRLVAAPQSLIAEGSSRTYEWQRREFEQERE